MSDSNLKNEFVAWMKKQKMHNGALYSENTVGAYASALKNSTRRLKLSDVKDTDLFTYTTIEDFALIHKRIIAAPNFNEVDKAAGNKAYSNGMKRYENFLREYVSSKQPSAIVLDHPLPEAASSLSINMPTSVPTDRIRSWMYAPGEGSRLWDEFYDKKIMGIGWEEIGDLREYATKDAMKVQLKKAYGESFTYTNAGLATWQFANEMKPGDIIYVKKGIRKIIGRGVVTSDYSFDPTRTEYNNVRDVRWTHKGEWDHDGQIVMKALTNITPYTDYCKKLEALFFSDEGTDADGSEGELRVVVYPQYKETDFLRDVYIAGDRYTTLRNLVLRKKNVILQGAPGVGKTYAAERLAYSIMGEKDTSRVLTIQFHQSYSYEDFIMGYRPNNTGFEVKNGPFYNFCKLAEPDDSRAYFFIIDEINRGNLSKIFGELLMLIESDKRGKEARLLYSDELFSVPQNVYVIGMMNTADRSLAMMDYALRRRFAFFDLKPAFDSSGFKTYQGNIGNAKFDALIQATVEMNAAIALDTSLGEGFRIGHSYFCTDQTVDDDWLRSLVEYELLPLINEYWFDESSKYALWSSRLLQIAND